MTTDPWLRRLTEEAHEPGLSRAMLQLERELGVLAAKDDSPRALAEGLRRDLATGANIVVEAGRRWARQFFPERRHEKLGAYYDWDLNQDIDDILRSINERPSPTVSRLVHEALAKGQHPQKVIKELARLRGIEDARDIARTVMMNIYAKGALREMDNHGYTHAIRMEHDDDRVCPVCFSLRGQVYDVGYLLTLPNPLTNDTHPRCRGSFVPLVNEDLVTPDPPGTRYVETFKTASGRTIQDAPIEYAMYLKRFFLRNLLPFDVVFDRKLPVDSRLKGSLLSIRPRALIDQDPRDLILEVWARKLWPKYREVFENEYLLMTKMGLVHPSKTVRTAQDYFVSEFTAFKTHQLEHAWEVLWFRNTVKE